MYEIERKFIVDTEKWKKVTKPDGVSIRQAYIFEAPGKSLRIRIRIRGNRAILTMKAGKKTLKREEFEYEIPLADGETLYKKYGEYFIEKTRYTIKEGKLAWEIDEFHGSLEGLIMAEVELEDEHQQVNLPEWVEKEVTEDKSYLNINLAKKARNTI